MSFTRTIRRVASLLIWLVVFAHAVSAGEETLSQAKDLYASAAYDEALAVLDRLQPSASGSDATAIAEYRVFCLLALDRRDDARTTIEAILTDNPNYLPSPDLASPRIQTVFRDARKQLLPKIVLERYASAKAAFERKDPQVVQRFEAVLALLDDPDAQGVPALSDLRTVVGAFHDLSKAMAAAKPEPASNAAPTAASNGAPAAATPENRVANPVSNPADVVYAARDVDVLPPVALSQKVPRWTPPRPSLAKQDFRGTLELLIDAQGAVVSAALRTSAHPLYDAELLKAARGWKFEPARKQGMPVRYLKIIDIHLTPGT